MSNVIVALSAGTNPFLDADNHINVEKVQALNAKINDIVSALPTVNDKGRAIKPPKSEMTFVISRKSKIAKFNTAMNRKGDLKYLTQRALKIASVRRLTERSSIRNLPLLVVYDATITGKLAPQVKQAVSAINTHLKRADKTKLAVGKEKGKIRDASNKEFDGALAAFRSMLDKAGVDLTKVMVESKGMMGRTVLLNVGKNQVVSIGKSDIAKFKAAQKKVLEAESESE